MSLSPTLSLTHIHSLALFLILSPLSLYLHPYLSTYLPPSLVLSLSLSVSLSLAHSFSFSTSLSLLGTIDAKELKVAMRALGFEPKKEEIKKMISGTKWFLSKSGVQNVHNYYHSCQLLFYFTFFYLFFFFYWWYCCFFLNFFESIFWFIDSIQSFAILFFYTQLSVIHLFYILTTLLYFTFFTFFSQQNWSIFLFFIFHFSFFIFYFQILIKMAPER